MDISSIYIHVPFCRHLCNYCDFFKYREGSKNAPSWNDFEGQLLNHWAELRKYEELNSWEVSSNKMQTIYLGGGTPSLWGKKGADFLSDFFERNKLNTTGSQWTLEIDPGTCTVDELRYWTQAGVNRFSIGLQTLDEGYLSIADREHSQKDAIEMLEMVSTEEQSFSADFLLGLPKLENKKRDIEKELEKILSYSPSHLSLYILTVPKSYVHFSLLPSEEEIEAEYLLVSKILRDSGFDHYEVSNFAKPAQESLHNFTYWEGKSYWGLGPSATGQWRREDNKMDRYKWNAKNELLIEKLGESELSIEKLYMGFRTKNGFDSKSIPENLISSWIEKDFIYRVGSIYRCTAKGYLVADSLINEVF